MVGILHIGSTSVALDPNSKLAQTLKQCDVNGDSQADVYETQGSLWERLMQLGEGTARVERNSACIAEAFSRAGELSDSPRHRGMQVTAIGYFLEAAPQLDQLIATVQDLRANNTNDHSSDDAFVDRNFTPQYYFESVVPQVKQWAANDQVGQTARLFQGTIRYFQGDDQAAQAWAVSSDSAIAWAKERSVRHVQELADEHVPALLRKPLQQYANDLSTSLHWLTSRHRYQCHEVMWGDEGPACFDNYVDIRSIYQ